MISDAAARAFDLMQGIEVCRKTDPQFWRQLVVRIIYDLDEAGAAKPLTAIKDLLGQMWERLDEADAKPGQVSAPIMRTGRSLSQTPGLCTLYRVTGDDWKAHECIGMMATPELAEAVCEAVNAYGRPLPPAPGLDGTSVQLAAEAMLARHESQYSAGHLTWRDFADDARAILEAALLPGSGEGSGDG